MGYNIVTDPPLSTPTKTDIAGWIQNYKEQFIEQNHDHTMLSLVSPDDSLVVIGSPRLSNSDEFYVIGLVNSIQYSESANVQPMKAIGSRRHIFARTNSPVQGSISRMMILGGNLYRALYAMTKLSDPLADRNAKFAVGANGEDSSWYTNLEEDLFRIPIGLGIIYNSPATIAEGSATSVGAEFIEVCSLVNRSVSKQSGQAIVMEQVSFMADRVVPWDAYAGPDFEGGSYANLTGSMVG